jgi:hypothetical protein
MITWLNLWTVSLIVAGASFAVITVIVAIKGAVDLKEMLQSLAKQQSDPHE